MRLAVLGGTFNPLHIAHATLADIAVRELGYDCVHIIPSYIPPHKQMAGGVSAEHRLGMVRAFCESDKRFVADDSEILRGGVSYTYDTVCALIEKYKDQLDDKLALLMGQESAGEFHKWNRAEDLASIVKIVIARRHEDLPLKNEISKNEANVPIGGYTGAFATDKEIENFQYDHIILDNVLLPLSSTQIRLRIAEGKSFRYLVPEPVFEYIRNNRLYGYEEK